MRITAAIDGSIHSKHSLATLAHFAPPEELALVHAMDLPDFNYPMITPELRTEAIEDMKKQLTKEGEGMLDQAQSALPSDFSNVQRIHQVGHPVEVILETARSSQSDLIMLGARGLGGFKELILGSVLTPGPPACSLLDHGDQIARITDTESLSSHRGERRRGHRAQIFRETTLSEQGSHRCVRRMAAATIALAHNPGTNQVTRSTGH